MGPTALQDEDIIQKLADLEFATLPLRVGDWWCLACYNKAKRLVAGDRKEAKKLEGEKKRAPRPQAMPSASESQSKAPGSPTLVDTLKNHRRAMARQMKIVRETEQTPGIKLAGAAISQNLSDMQASINLHSLTPES